MQRALLNLLPVVIGTTTDAAWNERLAGDSIVRENTHRLRVPEPSIEETVEILGVHKSRARARLRGDDRRRRPACRGEHGASATWPARRCPHRRWPCCTGPARCSSWPRSLSAKSPPPPAAPLAGGCAAARGGRHRTALCAAQRRPLLDADDVAVAVSVMTGIPVSKLGAGRARALRAHGRRAAPAHHRPGRGGAGGQPGGEDRPRGPERPEAAHRLVPLPRPDRRRQDRAGEGAGRVHVRHRRRHGRARHERVPAGPHRQPADRRAARATSATRAAGSSPRRCASVRTRSCCSTRWRRRTRACSTCCCRSWKRAG